jgi:N12 class adenine-specific DNA methylase
MGDFAHILSKELNEIEKLKKKSSLNSEELEKVSNESYYRNIVEPKKPSVPEYSEKQKEQAEKKRLNPLLEQNNSHIWWS